jgi:hypothetical protein
MQVRRVAGRLHFAVHQQSFLDVLPQMLTGHVLPRLTNMSHVVNKLAFGPEFPGQVNPLDGTIRVTKEGGKLFAYRYFVKVRRGWAVGGGCHAWVGRATRGALVQGCGAGRGEAYHVKA